MIHVQCVPETDTEESTLVSTNDSHPSFLPTQAPVHKDPSAHHTSQNPPSTLFLPIAAVHEKLCIKFAEYRLNCKKLDLDF